MRLHFSISRKDVHIWTAVLDQPSTITQQLLQLLSSDERRRADRFYFEKDKNHFIVARGLLRDILSHYLDVPASGLQFCYGPEGKPALGGKTSQPQLHFSLSHSHGLCLYAVSRERHVGIDLERVRPIPEAKQIAQSSFSGREFAVYTSASPTIREEMFFKYWTRKEAYLKGIGKGLGRSLEQVDMLADSDEPAVVVSEREKLHKMVDWHLQNLEPAQGYLGALAVEGQGWSVTYWQHKNCSVAELIKVRRFEGT